MRETTTLKPLRWREDKRRDWIKRAVITIVFVGAMFAAGFFFRAAAAAEYSGCHARIEPGDTLTEISQATGMAIDELVEVNDNVTNPNLIYAGDSLNVCDFRGEDPGDELAEFFRALESATLTYTVPGPVPVDVPLEVRDEPPARTIIAEPQTPAPLPMNEYMIDGIVTISGITYELAANTDLRGDELRTLAAVCSAESVVAGTGVAPRQYAEGDAHLMGNGWTESIGVCQVRSHRDQWGTGGPRDEEALRASVGHQAWAAGQIYASQGINAWSCYTACDWEHWLPYVDEALQEIFT